MEILKLPHVPCDNAPSTPYLNVTFRPGYDWPAAHKEIVFPELYPRLLWSTCTISHISILMAFQLVNVTCYEQIQDDGLIGCGGIVKQIHQRSKQQHYSVHKTHIHMWEVLSIYV